MLAGCGPGVHVPLGLGLALGVACALGVRSALGVPSGLGVPAGLGVDAGLGVPCGRAVGSGLGVACGRAVRLGLGVPSGLGVACGLVLHAGCGLIRVSGLPAQVRCVLVGMIAQITGWRWRLGSLGTTNDGTLTTIFVYAGISAGRIVQRDHPDFTTDPCSDTASRRRLVNFGLEVTPQLSSRRTAAGTPASCSTD